MTEVTFKLEPRQIASYQYAVRNHLKTVPGTGWLAKEWVHFLLAAGVSLSLYIAIEWLLPLWTGVAASWPDVIIGAFAGIVFLLIGLWLAYLKQRQALVREHGPTLSLHTIAVTAEGLGVSAPLMHHHYAWGLFDEVTEHKDLILLWIEPGMALIVPHGAFADAAKKDGFIADVRARIAAAKKA